MKKCKKCGYVNEDDALFCYSCGNNLDAVQPAPKPPIKPPLPLKTLLLAVIAVALIVIAVMLVSRNFGNGEAVSGPQGGTETEFPAVPESDGEIEEPPELPIELPQEAPAEPPELTCSVMMGTIIKGGFNQIKVSRVDASSELINGRWNFPAEHAVDGNRKTSWQEYVTGDGVGEYLTVYFDQPVSLSVIEIYAGYQADEAGFKANCRPSSLLLSFSDGRSVEVRLEDKRAAHTVVLDYPVETEYVRLTITGAYQGTKWDDNVITDVSFFG